MFRGLTNIMMTAVILQIKMVIVYYCLYSAVVYNFLMSIMSNPLTPQYLKDNDKFILLLLSIISAHTLDRKMKAPAKVQQEERPLNILKPGQRIN